MLLGGMHRAVTRIAGMAGPTGDARVIACNLPAVRIARIGRTHVDGHAIRFGALSFLSGSRFTSPRENLDVQIKLAIHNDSYSHA